MKGLSSGPEQAHEDEEKQQRAHSGEGVDDLPDALGMVETEPVAELDSQPPDREEPRRRVVAPGGSG